MADKAIGSLVEATVINDADRFVLEQSGQAKQISGATMISELAEALDGHGGIQSIDLVSGDGNVKTYRITFTDGTTYDYEVRDGESGNYAVVAGNLAPYSDASGATQSIPFLSQGTGRGNGSATVSAGNYCQLKKKLGNTVCVNQLVDAPTSGSTTVSGVTVSWNNGKATLGATATSTAYITLKTGIPTVSGHKLLVMGLPTAVAGVSLYDDSSLRQFTAVTTRTIFTASGANIAFKVRVDSGISPNCIVYPLIIDLTTWYGSNDRIPSDLLSHPENWGRYFAGSLDYNAGTLESADGTVLKSIGRNLFDKDTMTITDKYISDSNGNANTQVGSICTDFIEVIPNTAYYIYTEATSGRWGAWYDRDKNFIAGIQGSANKTAPADARYIRFTIKYSNSTGGDKETFCISLYYPGESGYDQYYPYTVLAEVDTGSEVLRSAGIYADEKLPSGLINRNVKQDSISVTQMYSHPDNTSVDFAVFSVSEPWATPEPNGFICSCAVKAAAGVVNFANAANAGMMLTYSTPNKQLAISVAKGTTLAQAQALLNGHQVAYGLATPTTEQGTAFPENIPCDPVGSMSWENTNGIPQGAEIFYPFDYAGTLDSMIDALPSANGTYTFKATVSSGKITYSWVAD